MKQYIYVPYKEKDEAKNLGAKWDNVRKLWYISDHNENMMKRWGPINKLVGENRQFGGNKLYVDLIPASCWFTNVRYCVKDSDWYRLRKYVYERVNNICECCKKVSDLEAHERWDYDNDQKIQKLVRLVGLCSDCHRVTHIGLAEINGYGEDAFEHLKKVLDISDEECEKHIEDAYDIWEERSKFDWKLDLSILIDNGIEIVKPVNKNDRKNIINNYILY